MPFFDRRKFMTSLTGVAGATLAGSIGASGEPSFGDSHSYPKLRITDIKTRLGMATELDAHSNRHRSGYQWLR